MLVKVENKLYINIICSIFNCLCWLFLILSQLLNVEQIDVYVSCTAVVLELCHRTTVLMGCCLPDKMVVLQTTSHRMKS